MPLHTSTSLLRFLPIDKFLKNEAVPAFNATSHKASFRQGNFVFSHFSSRLVPPRSSQSRRSCQPKGRHIVGHLASSSQLAPGPQGPFFLRCSACTILSIPMTPPIHGRDLVDGHPRWCWHLGLYWHIFRPHRRRELRGWCFTDPFLASPPLLVSPSFLAVSRLFCLRLARGPDGTLSLVMLAASSFRINIRDGGVAVHA